MATHATHALMPMADVANQLGSFLMLMLYSITTNPLGSALKPTSVGHAYTRFKGEFLNYGNYKTEAQGEVGMSLSLEEY